MNCLFLMGVLLIIAWLSCRHDRNNNNLLSKPKARLRKDSSYNHVVAKENSFISFQRHADEGTKLDSALFHVCPFVSCFSLVI